MYFYVRVVIEATFVQNMNFMITCVCVCYITMGDLGKQTTDVVKVALVKWE